MFCSVHPEVLTFLHSNKIFHLSNFASTILFFPCPKKCEVDEPNQKEIRKLTGNYIVFKLSKLLSFFCLSAVLDGLTRINSLYVMLYLRFSCLKVRHPYICLPIVIHIMSSGRDEFSFQLPTFRHNWTPERLIKIEESKKIMYIRLLLLDDDQICHLV